MLVTIFRPCVAHATAGDTLVSYLVWAPIAVF